MSVQLDLPSGNLSAILNEKISKTVTLPDALQELITTFFSTGPRQADVHIGGKIILNYISSTGCKEMFCEVRKRMLNTFREHSLIMTEGWKAERMWKTNAELIKIARQ